MSLRKPVEQEIVHHSVGVEEEEPSQAQERKMLVRQTVKTLLKDGHSDLPAAFLEVARNPESEQHKLFEPTFWDDRYMADQARLSRIRVIISRVTIDDGDKRPCAIAIPKIDVLTSAEGEEHKPWVWKSPDSLDKDELVLISQKELARVRAALDNIRELRLDARFADWRKLASLLDAWKSHPV